MIELHRLAGKVPRRVVVRNFALVSSGFIVLAASGVGLAWLQRNTSTQTANSPAPTTNSSPTVLGSNRTTDKERITDGDPAADTSTAQTATATTASTSSNVVRPAATTALIADHRVLFEQALNLLTTYEQHIASGAPSRYVEATNMKGALDLAISKTAPTAIGADGRAAYESSIMLAVSSTSSLLSDAASLYANALYEYANSVDGAEQKLLAGRQKATSAQTAFKAIP